MSQAAPLVFVSDDDIAARKSLEELVRTEGCNPEVFPSTRAVPGPSAGVCAELPHLDVALPDLDGLGLQKRAAPDRADTPIIFIEGRSSRVPSASL
jgi:FixJ family two-component response regulator